MEKWTLVIEKIPVGNFPVNDAASKIKEYVYIIPGIERIKWRTSGYDRNSYSCCRNQEYQFRSGKLTISLNPPASHFYRVF